jgi:hypothetical protein
MSKKTNQQNPPQNNTTSVAGKLQTKHIVLILGTLVIIASAVVAAYVLTRPNDTDNFSSIDPNITPIGRIEVINESNVTELIEEVRENVAKGRFSTHMNTTWRFPDGSSPSSNAVMGNSARNNYPMWFEVRLQENNELIFTSPVLPLGTQIEEIVLDRVLSKGTYPAALSIHMIDDDGEIVQGNMGFSISLVIQN